MQIQLKQAEIVSALKGYIQAQGINLAGKTVEISFTAGRGQAGLTADLVIEETAPKAFDFSDLPAGDDAHKPVLSVVSNTTTEAQPEAQASDPLPELPATGTDDAATAASTTKSTTSLFG